MCRFKIVFSISIACLLLQTMLKAQTPADSAQIYLITASSGDEVNSAFGHSAIRVFDPTRNYDMVYGFGTYDFSESNFYGKFIFGNLMYFLSKKHYPQFVYEYQYYGQALYLQKLNLTNSEKWKLISNLEETISSDRRFYRYDFFYDNCATRIRDVIEQSVSGKIIYDSSYIKKPETFRQLIDPDLGRTPWIFFGTNILLGKGTDSIAVLKHYMFLPLHLKNIMAQSRITRGDSIVPLTNNPVELFPTTLTFEKPSSIMSPGIVMGIVFILILILSYWSFKRKISLRWFDFGIFFVTGLLGILITVLTLWSAHSELHHNSNLFWANPGNLVIAFGLLFARNKKWYKIVTCLFAMVLLIFVLVSFFIMQDIPTGGLFISLILAVRLVNYGLPFLVCKKIKK